MKTFSFLSAGRIDFGAGRIAKLGEIAAGLGRRAMLVTGGHSLESSGRLAAILAGLKEHGIDAERAPISGEPTVEDVEEATATARRAGCNLVIAIGGGSVLDAGKAVAALLGNGGEAMDYLEVVGRGLPITKPSAPMIAAPTTAGTGSEVTKNAVISNRAGTFKRSMRADTMIPTVALVDPELTHDCPPMVTALSGMDALTQLLESLTSRTANPMTDALAREGLAHAFDLAILADDPGDVAARESMSVASVLGGLCLANAGLGVVHGLASPLGAYHPAPHGGICAALVPHATRINAARANEMGDTATVARYAEAYRLALGSRGGALLIEEPAEADNDAAAADALADLLEAMNARLGVPGLGAYGVMAKDFGEIIDTGSASNLRRNPVELTETDLRLLLRAAL